MKKQIKKWGRSLVISFDEEEQKIYGLKEGSVIDMGDMMVINSNSNGYVKVKQGLNKLKKFK